MVVSREADIVRVDGRETVVSVVREIRGTASMYILDDGLGDVHWGHTWPALRSTAVRPGYLCSPRGAPVPDV